MTHPPFQLLLFYRDVAFSAACVGAGVDGLIIDLENRSKSARQLGFDTEINTHTLADLEAAKALKGAQVLCRINGPSPDMSREIADVLCAGADEIIVPMIKHMDEAQAAVEAISGAAKITLMVETVEALAFVPALCALPIERIYVGLNDLRISRGSASIFEPLVDATLEQIRADVQGVQFGFGGLTLPGRGDPLPVHHLVGALARMRADFTFLRRSFYRDAMDLTAKDALGLIRQEIAQARAKDAAQMRIEFEAMKAAITAMVPHG